MSHSRLSKFYAQTLSQRQEYLKQTMSLSGEEEALLHGALSPSDADLLSENVVATYGLPFSLATNFTINGQDLLIPMSIEEPSVVAAASHGALLARHSGGFTAIAQPALMMGQIQLFCQREEWAVQTLLHHRDQLLADGNALIPSLASRGGGLRTLDVRILRPSTPQQPAMLVVDLTVDCCDAMGANLVNTLAEGLAPQLAQLCEGEFGLRILSNRCDERLVTVTCTIQASALASPHHDGPWVRDRIIAASEFAQLDAPRATTHNKGIMNGVDAVAVATSNDWRAIEAAAHAFASRTGVYQPLSLWQKNQSGDLVGTLNMPIPVGTVGRVQRHPLAALALKILGQPTSQQLACVMGAVGLANNLAALRALVDEGIQHGHMALHRRQ